MSDLLVRFHPVWLYCTCNTIPFGSFYLRSTKACCTHIEFSMSNHAPFGTTLVFALLSITDIFPVPELPVVQFILITVTFDTALDYCETSLLLYEL